MLCAEYMKCLCNPAICTCFTYRLHNAKQSKVLYTCADYICYIIYICYVILRYVPVLPHTDYIMQTVESTIYYVRYVPVLSHTDYILKNSRKGYIYVPLYEMSKNSVICTCSHTEYIILNSRDGYIYVYVSITRNVNENVALCTCSTYRLYNAKQPRWLYICICINHTEC
jgi:hypothetical protein